MAQRSETRSVPSTAIDVTVNGESRAVDVDNRTTLLDLLRERLDLVGWVGLALILVAVTVLTTARQPRRNPHSP